MLSRRTVELFILFIAVLGLQGCDNTSALSSSERPDAPSGTTAPLDVGFTTASGASGSKATSTAGDSIVVSGSSGTLILQDVRLIVSGTELETDGDEADEDDRSEYKTTPSFLDLPLDTSTVSVLDGGNVPTGTYDQLEFEVEDMEYGEADDNDDGAEQQQLQDLLNGPVQNEFPNWPKGASMRVSGTFTPTNGTAQSFATYFDAEIEVERTLTPPVDVTASGPGRTLTVSLSPERWFVQNNGSVRNLAADDYGSTGRLVAFESEFEDGVLDVESEEDDEYEDDDDDRDEDDDDHSEDDDDRDDNDDDRYEDDD